MRKFLFLLLPVVGLMACSTAPPPEETAKAPGVETSVVAKDFIISDALFTGESWIDAGKSSARVIAEATVNSHSKIFVQVWEVPGKSGDLVFNAGDLPTETNRLYASLSVGMQDEPVESVEKDSSKGLNTESIIGVIMFILTTIFGTYFKKYLGKFKQAIGLLEAFHNALEDGNITKSEIAELKQKYYQLIGKKG